MAAAGGNGSPERPLVFLAERLLKAMDHASGFRTAFGAASTFLRQISDEIGDVAEMHVCPAIPAV